MKTYEDFQRLIILDYSTCEVHIYLVAPNVDVDIVYVTNLGFSESNINWMIGKYKDININFHKEVLL